MPPRMLLRQNIHSAKKGEMRARFSLSVSCSRSSSPRCPQLILSLSILQRANFVYDEEKHRHREKKRDSIKPRLKREEYHALSLFRDVHTRGERERHTNNKREHKAHLETQSRVFPQQRMRFSIYKERLCLFE